MKPSGLLALHERYAAQARWTEALRKRLLAQIELPSQPQVLEIGSGTGCITAWFSTELGTRVWGIDLDRPTVQFAQAHDLNSGYAQANGASLPFPAGHFDLVFCHFLLLWTPDPALILNEMKRCLRPQGWLIAFAEPDYSARIDYPDRLGVLGTYQKQALKRRGAQIDRGRELRGLFADTGLQHVQAGLLGGEWSEDPPDDLESEWAILRADLAGKIPDVALNELEQLDRQAWADQKRILFVPTFFALGQNPGHA